MGFYPDLNNDAHISPVLAHKSSPLFQYIHCADLIFRCSTLFIGIREVNFKNGEVRIWYSRLNS